MSYVLCPVHSPAHRPPWLADGSLLPLSGLRAHHCCSPAPAMLCLYLPITWAHRPLTSLFWAGHMNGSPLQAGARQAAIPECSCCCRPWQPTGQGQGPREALAGWPALNSWRGAGKGQGPGREAEGKASGEDGSWGEAPARWGLRAQVPLGTHSPRTGGQRPEHHGREPLWAGWEPCSLSTQMFWRRGEKGELAGEKEAGLAGLPKELGHSQEACSLSPGRRRTRPDPWPSLPPPGISLALLWAHRG